MNNLILKLLNHSDINFVFDLLIEKKSKTKIFNFLMLLFLNFLFIILLGVYLFDISNEAFKSYVIISMLLSLLFDMLGKYIKNKVKFNKNEITVEDKKLINELKAKKINSSEKLFDLFISYLSEKEIVENLDLILEKATELKLKQNNIFFVINEKIKIENISHYYIKNIKNIEKLITNKINGSLDVFFEIENEIKKIIKDKDIFYKFKYKIIKENVDNYPKSENYIYIDKMISFLEDTKINQSKLYALKKIKEESVLELKEVKVENNILNELNNKDFIKNF